MTFSSRAVVVMALFACGPVAPAAAAVRQDGVQDAPALTVHGEGLVSFDGPDIPAGGVATRSNTRDIPGRRALPSGRLARLDAAPVLDEGLPGFDSDAPVLRLDAAAGIPVAKERDWQDTVKPERKRGNGVMIGALVGAGAALIATGVMADRYGQNEGGRFCSRCMVEWSVITVPVGAGIGAAVGYGVDRARRSVTVMPVVSRRAGGVVVSAAF